MPLRLLHTADLHLGMKFTGRYPPQVQERLIRARLETLHNLVEAANAAEAAVLVIAGDLFHDHHLPRRDIRAAAEALGDFAGRVVLILPGNHDFLQEGECPLWDRFLEAADDQVLLLKEARPYSLLQWDLPLMIYPGPCTAKHSPTNAIGWIEPGPRDPDFWHIGVAHGSLEGVSPDFEGQYYPMTWAELTLAHLDLWLLGHTHVRLPEGDQGREGRVFVAGTPEPDGFDCRHPGNAWLIELNADRSLSYRGLVTGRHRFAVHEVELSTEDDLEAFRARFRQFDPERDLIRLILRGRLPGELFAQRGQWLEELQQQVLYLEADLSRLFRRITAEDVNREFTAGSFPHQLLTRLVQAGGDPRVLQLAYDLIQEVRS